MVVNNYENSITWRFKTLFCLTLTRTHIDPNHAFRAAYNGLFLRKYTYKQAWNAREINQIATTKNQVVNNNDFHSGRIFRVDKNSCRFEL